MSKYMAKHWENLNRSRLCTINDRIANLNEGNIKGTDP